MVEKEPNRRRRMMELLPLRLRPLNLFQLQGTLCCRKMSQEFDALHFVDHFFCYEAKTITEANVLFLWGSFSKKLVSLLDSKLDDMIQNKFIIHIRGCEKRVDNQFSSSSLTHLVPVNFVFSSCTLDKPTYHNIVNEARQCLRV